MNPLPTTPADDLAPNGQYSPGLCARENQMIHDRRAKVPGGVQGPVWGAALSGGGIRSATFCLGVFQALGRSGLVRRLDLLSTVSGGGYFGSFLGRLYQGPVPAPDAGEDPLDRSPDGVEAVLRNENPFRDTGGERPSRTPLDRLRDAGRYLSPSGGVDDMMMLATWLRNWVAVALALFTLFVTGFLALNLVRAVLWFGPFEGTPLAAPQGWQRVIENAALQGAGPHLWWSPVWAGALAIFLLYSIPLAWAYWLSQAGQDQDRPRWPNWLPVLALGVLATAGAWAPFLLKDSLTPVLRDAADALTLSSILGGIMLWLAAENVHGARPGGLGEMLWPVVVVLAGAVGFVGLGLHHASEVMQSPVSVAVGLSVIAWVVIVGAARRLGALHRTSPDQLQRTRSVLSQWLPLSLGLVGGAAALAVIDTWGQSLYAFSQAPDRQGLGWSALLGVFGFGGVPLLARWLSSLSELGGSKRRFQAPLNLILLLLGIVLLAGMLTAASVVAHGVAWRGNEPGPVGCQNEPVYPGRQMLAAAQAKKAAAKTYQVNFGGLKSDGATAIVEPPAPSAADAPAPCQPVEKIPVAEMDWKILGGATLAALLFALGFGNTLGFLNLSSFSVFYSGRIARAFQGASNPNRLTSAPPPLYDLCPGDDLPLAAYRPDRQGGPLHLVNTTVNETIGGDSQIESRDRKGFGLCLGPAGVTVRQDQALWTEPPDGEPNTGSYLEIIADPGHSFGLRKKAAAAKPKAKPATPPGAAPGPEPEPEKKPEPPVVAVETLSLGRWIGISGAAFSSGTGANNSLGKSLVTTLLNVRLGHWWGTALGSRSQGGLTRRAAGLLTEIVPVYGGLLSELLCQFHGTRHGRWYLSDGGHYENLGAYELVRRRVPFILACDNGADPDSQFEDVANFLRLIRIDFHAEITWLTPPQIGNAIRQATQAAEAPELKYVGVLDDLRHGVKDPEDPEKPAHFARRHAALGVILYPDGAKSLLLLLKPTLTRDVPVDLRHYHSTHTDFPQETTADQFFDQAQWESYRKLGEVIAGRVIAELGLEGGAKWDAIRQELLAAVKL